MSTLDDLEEERYRSSPPPACRRCEDKPAVAEYQWITCAPCGVYLRDVINRARAAEKQAS